MRCARTLGTLALLAWIACACDTTQPLQVDEQTYALAIRSTTASVSVYDVYDGFEDTDGDGAADDTDGDGDGDFFLFCRPTTSETTTTFASSVPFGYTIEVTILRAGETVRERVTSPIALNDSSASVTEYDQFVPNIPGVPPAISPIMIGARTFKFESPRRRSAANLQVASSTSNPLFVADPGTYGFGNGLCSLAFYGPPVVDAPGANNYPLTFTLGKGDSVTVKAIRALEPYPNAVPGANLASVQIQASLTTEGRTVAVEGTTGTSPATNNSFAFTFQSF
jgi:hypothetical protein